jgi:hypothetical protein
VTGIEKQNVKAPDDKKKNSNERSEEKTDSNPGGRIT